MVFTNFGSGTAIHKMRRLVRSKEYSRVLNDSQRSKKSFFEKLTTKNDVCVKEQWRKKEENVQAKALASQVKSSLRTAARTSAHACFLVEAMCERTHLYPIFLILKILNPGQWKALHWSLLHGVRFANKIFLGLLPDMFCLLPVVRIRLED